MLVIVAIPFTSCGSDSEDEPSVKPDKSAIIAQKIVGVWKEEGHFVSFSQSGYNSAFLDYQTIDEGDYQVSGDTITVSNNYRGIKTTYVIKSVTDSTLSCVTTYLPFNIDGNTTGYRTKNFLFKKSSESPCSKNHNLIGKSYDSMYSGGYDGRATFVQYNVMDFYRTWNKLKYDHLSRYYVYLPPKDVYFVQWADNGATMWGVFHLTFTLNSDGQIDDFDQDRAY